MKKQIMATAFAVILAGSCMLTACTDTTKKRNPEVDALRLSIQPVEGLFSPFFSTSGTDSSVVGMTQTSMLSTDRNGNIAFGDEEPCVVKDYSMQIFDANGRPISTSVDPDNETTRYQFVIKNGIKFADGKPLTIKDVLFNLYVYLDPVYTGSTTIYSTDIVGLKEYRSLGQASSGKGESALESTARGNKELRWDNLYDYLTVRENVSTLTEEEAAQAAVDAEALAALFKQEVENDWVSAGESLENYTKEYDVSEQWQVYLLMEGVISVKQLNGKSVKTSDGKYVVDYTAIKDSEDFADHGKENMLSAVYSYYQADTRFRGRSSNFAQIMYWASGTTLENSILADETSKQIEKIQKEGSYPRSVSGISVVKGSDFVSTSVSHANTYTNSYDVLQIVINGVDPKAIWNFGFTVAPMHYYSDSSVSSKFTEAVDYHAFNAPGVDGYDNNASNINFGFPMGNYTYFTDVIQSRNNLPMGAGVYMPTNINDASFTSNYSAVANGFYDGSMIYYTRNPYFYTNFTTDESKASEYNSAIKKVRYKIVDTANVMNALKAGEIDYADVGATTDNQNEVAATKSLGQSMARTNGYGYIGINSKYVQDINLRRAIMSVFDANLVRSYYPGDLSSIITRPLTLASWVYDEPNGSKWEPKAVYSFDATASTPNLTEYNKYMEAARTSCGLRQNSSGMWEYMTDTGYKALKFTFTIAGGTDDHPAYQTLSAAAEVLNKNGWDISINPDSRALTKLATGSLQIWCAAWSATIDPDMYQVYHMDSKATNTLAWGYDWIKAHPEKADYALLTELSELIDLGRTELANKDRVQYYRDALDVLMELAVEFPLYQRNDLFVYNKTIIDVSTLDTNPTSYSSPIAYIWKVNYAK